MIYDDWRVQFSRAVVFRSGSGRAAGVDAAAVCARVCPIAHFSPGLCGYRRKFAAVCI